MYAGSHTYACTYGRAKFLASCGVLISADGSCGSAECLAPRRDSLDFTNSGYNDIATASAIAVVGMD